MPRPASSVTFARSVRGVGRSGIRDFHHRLRSELTAGRDFACLITGNYALRRLNREFLGKDYATDVLSFPAAGLAAPDATLGDIAISAERAGEQADEFGHSLDDEIKILMLHGVLHLLGFDHERDRGAMARAETRWRKRFALPTALIERAHRRSSR